MIKFDGASGAELWRQATDASNDSIFPAAQAVAVDGANGAELWRQSLVGGEGRAVALDSKSDVIAAGDLNNLATVMKLDRKDGGSPKREPGADGRAARDSERQRCGRAPLRSAEGGP